MQLNWFSPLLPEQTDIAHFTARLAPALTAKFDVVFWTSQGAKPENMPSNAQIKFINIPGFIDRDLYISAFSGINIYNLGNDARFHREIAFFSQHIPGVVILHDAKMHHFALECARSDNPEFSGYFGQAHALYGRDGRIQAKKIVEGHAHIDDYVTTMPFIEPYLENAIGVVCHTEVAKADIRALSDTPALVLPLPFSLLSAGCAPERRFEPPWRFVAFGYMNPNRRLEQILLALSQWTDAPQFELDILGALWDADLVKRIIDDLGLNDKVHLRGFVRESVLDDVIAGAHLAFNLRYPTMGEASGGVLRCWAHATPVLVTNDGWYSSLPTDVAVKISMHSEVAEIVDALRRLVRSPASFRTIGEAGRKRLQLHAPEHYAESLQSALADISVLSRRVAARWMMKRFSEKPLSPTERNAALVRCVPAIASLFES